MLHESHYSTSLWLFKINSIRINNGTRIILVNIFRLDCFTECIAISLSMFLRSKTLLHSQFHRPNVSYCITLLKKTCLESILDARDLQDFQGHLLKINRTDFFFEWNNKKIIDQKIFLCNTKNYDIHLL